MKSNRVSFKAAEEERAAKEAEARKARSSRSNYIQERSYSVHSKKTKKDARVEELSAWDESRLTGFSEALAAMPEPTQRYRENFWKR